MSLGQNKTHQELFPLSSWDVYYNTKINQISRSLAEGRPDVYEIESKQRALNFFHQVSSRVPAYKDFLKKHKIEHTKVKTIEDFQRVPWVDKANYLYEYPLDSLCWNGKVTAPIISASSGSTGTPFFWPRSFDIEMETTYIYELFLKDFFEIDKYKTLLINGFSMGMYIGGTFTLNCSMRIAQKGYPLTVITPGINKNEILDTIERLHSSFDQVVLSGYPPFIRDIIDDGSKRGIDWRKMKLKFFFASESLSEEFRSYIYEKVGIGEDAYYFSSMNLYGTADAAIMGHETPLSTFVRKLFSKDRVRSKKFFGTDYVPSLNQFYPHFKYVEIDGGEVVLTAFNAEIPLVRYNIHDKGKIVTYPEMVGIIESFGFTEKETVKITGRKLWRLPYIYLYGRSDFTVTMYGLNIYPENIKAALETKELIDIATGKFVLETLNRPHDQSQYLAIHIEVRNGVIITKDLERTFQDMIIATLRIVNLEYNHLYRAIKLRANPEIDLRALGDKEFFAPATKQRWVKK